MKKLLTSLASGVLMISGALAQPVLTENFNYGTTAGDLTTVSSGAWILHSGTAPNPVQYATGSLSFSGYPDITIGGSASFANNSGSREDVNLALPTAINSGDVYFSFLVNISSVTGAGDYNVHLMECATSSCTAFRPRVSFRPGVAAGTVDVGISKSAGATGANWGSDDAIPVNQTFLVVVKYSFVTGTGNDPVSMYVITGAIPASEPVSSTADASDLSGTDAATIAAVGFRQGSIGTSGITVDGIRVATSWANLQIGAVADAVTSPGFSSTLSTSTSFDWTLPGTYQNSGNTILVFVKQGSGITQGTPSSNVSTYTADNDFSGSGTAYENDAAAKCVYKGDGSSVSITGLTANTNYHVLIYNVVDASSTYSTAVTDDVTTSAPPALPVIRFDNTSISFSEGDGLITATGSVSNANGTATSFDLVIAGGTATTADHDFVSPFSAGTPAGYNGPIAGQLTLTDDQLVEGNETILFTFTNLVNCVVDPLYDTLELIITDNDFSKFRLGAATYTATEGVDDSLSITVKYVNPGPVPTAVTFTATPGTATQGVAADYVYTSQTLTFTGGADTLKTVKIKIVDRHTTENTETFSVALSNPTNSATLDNPSSATISIINRASYPHYPIGSINTVDANGICDSLGKRYEVRGVVYGINLRPAGLEYAFRDNTGGIRIFNGTGNLGYAAGAEGDSLIVIGQVNQFNGLAEIDFIDTIIVVGTGKPIADPRHADSLTEAEESDLVYFTNMTILDPVTNWAVSGSGSNYNVTNGIDTFQVRIIPAMTDIAGAPVPAGPFTMVGIGGQFDASVPRTSGYQFFPRRLSDIFEGGPTVQFSTDTATVNEDAGTVSVNVTIQNPAIVGTTVTVQVAGTATSGSDFTYTPASVYFPAGSSASQSFDIDITDDNATENAETIVLTITVSAPGTVGTVSTHTITINDNDPNSVKQASNEKAISVYPNPSNGLFNVEAEENIEKIIVRDMTGKVIFENNVSSNKTVVDLTSMPQGIYTVQVFGNGNTVPSVSKIIRK